MAADLDMIGVEQHDEHRHAGDHGVELHPDQLAPGRFEPRLVRQEALLTNDAFTAKSSLREWLKHQTVHVYGDVSVPAQNGAATDLSKRVTTCLD